MQENSLLIFAMGILVGTLIGSWWKSDALREYVKSAMQVNGDLAAANSDLRLHNEGLRVQLLDKRDSISDRLNCIEAAVDRLADEVFDLDDDGDDEDAADDDTEIDEMLLSDDDEE